jgi:hypothetical protein
VVLVVRGRAGRVGFFICFEKGRGRGCLMVFALLLEFAFGGFVWEVSEGVDCCTVHDGVYKCEKLERLEF